MIYFCSKLSIKTSVKIHYFLFIDDIHLREKSFFEPSLKAWKHLNTDLLLLTTDSNMTVKKKNKFHSI